MKKRFAAFVSTVLAAVLCACSAAPKDVLPNKAAQPTEAPTQQAQTTQAAPTEQPTPEPDLVQQLLEEMTLEQKVGQLFLVRPDSLDLGQTQDQINDAKADGVTELTDAMRQTLAEYPVGGVVIFGKNLESPQQITQFLGDLQQASDTPLFTAIDEEGGLVARLANNAAFDLPQYESAAAVGTSGNPEDARAMGRTIGGYLKEYGFNLDFAPVADVNTNPDNPVIGTRAFSSEPQTAADLVGGACAGFADAGIACTLKHFPGHGDTSEDTHVGTVTLNKTLDDLRSCELVPFAQNVNNAPLIMAAHITVPQVTGDDTPASLSSVMLTDLLRGELGYQGLIVTDSLAIDYGGPHYRAAGNRGRYPGLPFQRHADRSFARGVGLSGLDRDGFAGDAGHHRCVYPRSGGGQGAAGRCRPAADAQRPCRCLYRRAGSCAGWYHPPAETGRKLAAHFAMQIPIRHPDAVTRCRL